MIASAGSDLPEWDQWWVDFGGVVAPLADGSFQISNLARMHDGNRHFTQRLVTLALLKLSFRWEPLEGLVLSALLRSLGLAMVFLLLARRQPRGVTGALLVLAALVGSLPTPPLNVLSTSTAPLFVAESLALVSLFLLCDGRLTAWRFTGGVSLLLAGLLNAGSAWIAASAAALVLLLKGQRERPGTRRPLPVIAALGVLAVFMFVTAPPDPGRGIPSFAALAATVAQILSWPFPDIPMLAVPALIPSLLLLRRIARASEPGRPSWFLLAASVYSLCVVCAGAFRSGGVAAPAPGLGVDGLWLAQLVGFATISEALRPSGSESPSLRNRACLAWAVWLGAALLSDASLRGGPMLERARLGAAMREPVFARAVRSGDLAGFQSEALLIERRASGGDASFRLHPTARFAIPSPFLTVIAERRDPVMARLPAALVGAPPSPLHRAFEGVRDSHPLITAIGVALLAYSLFALRSPWRPLAGR